MGAGGQTGVKSASIVCSRIDRAATSAAASGMAGRPGRGDSKSGIVGAWRGMEGRSRVRS